MKKTIHINSKLAEKSSEIIQWVETYKKILLISPMGTGKTYITMNDFVPLAKNQGKKVVIVIPNVSQNNQVQNQYNKAIEAAICDGRGYGNEDVVVCTPDSLPKIVKKLKSNSFYLIVDEAHSIYTDYSFREAFGNIPEANKKAFKVIYMTATAEIFEGMEHEKIDITINVKADERITVGCVELVKISKINKEVKRGFIKKYAKGKTLIANNNKQENLEYSLEFEVFDEYVKQELAEPHQEDLLGRTQPVIFETTEKDVKYSSGVVSSKSKKDETYEAIVNGGKLIHDMTLTTSAIQAGINIDEYVDTVIFFVDRDTVYSSLIQLMGRPRQGIGKVYIIINDSVSDVGYMNIAAIRSPQYEIAEDNLRFINSQYKKDKDYVQDKSILKQTCGALCVKYDETKDEFVMDYQALEARIYKKYSKQLFIHTNFLAKGLKNNPAIEIKDLKINHLDAEEFEHEETDGPAPAVDNKKELYELLLRQHDEFLDIVHDSKKIDWRTLDKDISFALKTMYEDKRVFTQIKQLIKFKHFKENNQAIRFVLRSKKKEVDKLLRNLTIIDINRRKKKNINDYMSDVGKNNRKALEALIIKIRYELQDIDGSNGSRGRLTDFRENQLFQALLDERYIDLKLDKLTDKQKEKAISKARQALVDDLSAIYNFKGDNLISSIKSKL